MGEIRHLEKIECIKDYYGHQSNIDNAFGLMREYVVGNLRYEVSHVVVNRELYIQIREHAGTCILFASYDHRFDIPNRYTTLIYLNQRQCDDLDQLRQNVLELPYEVCIEKGIMIDGVWDSIILYGVRKTGYTWGSKPMPPYHVLQELVNTIYSFLPPANGHLIERDSDDRYKGLV